MPENLPQGSAKSSIDHRSKRSIGRAGYLLIAVLLATGIGSLVYTRQLLAVVDWLSSDSIKPNFLERNPQLDDDEKLMYALSHVRGVAAADATKTIVDRADQRFVPVLIEVLVANESEHPLFGTGTHRIVQGLEQLTGENFREEAESSQKMAEHWLRWYVTTDLEPPRAFAGWKGILLAQAVPNSNLFLKNGVRADVRLEEIHAPGGRSRSGPSLNNPKMIPATESNDLKPEEPVVGLRINGESRAYPQRIVDWHQTVNDVVGGVPISLTCCGHSGAIVCHERRDHNGGVMTFNPSGLVYRGNELLYDDETHSLWCPITGRPIVGELSGDENSIRPIPVVVSTWTEWKEEHPDTLVLSLNTGFNRNYEPGAARGRYFASDATTFPFTPPSEGLSAKSRIFGLMAESERISKAYPVADLAKSRVVNDVVGKTPYVLVATNGLVTVDYRRRRGNAKYVAGGEVRAYRRGAESFHPSNDSETVLDSSGQRWEITEEALVGPSERKLERVAGVQAFWFGWHALHPDGELYRAVSTN